MLTRATKLEGFALYPRIEFTLQCRLPLRQRGTLKSGVPLPIKVDYDASQS